MRKEIIIIGAGGHGKVVADIAECMGYKRINFLDDSDTFNPRVVGKTDEFERYIKKADFFVAIGNSKVREKLFRQLADKGADIATLIHPNAAVSKSAKIGAGVAVMAGAVINADSIIGNGVIVNTCSSVDHDCVVGDFCHIAVGAHICGTVTVGRHTWVGAGATVINNVNICADCMIGAGAVVVKNIDRTGLYKGLPAVWEEK